ncbi:MAG TPA: hypothetical protein DEA38_15695 [Stenotrophomonas sp.]|nr:hypothetical protein [Stenotrophomonas sp.]
MREVAVLLAGPALWQFTPLFKALRVGHGGSSLQALRLAISLLLDLLQDFRDKGGVLFYPPRDEFPIEANVCGIARR